MPQARYHKLRKVLAHRQRDMTLLCDKVHKSKNISAILRSADAVGIERIHMVKPEHGRLIYHHTAGGSSRFVDVSVYEHLQEGIDAVKASGMRIYAAHWSSRAISYRQADYTVPFALILGAEKYGLSELAEAQADEHLTIPMIGACESYNVSVASGIILQEAMHQRMEAGLYDRSDEILTENEVWKLFRWLHPKMAAFCDARQLPYPELDEDGDIIPPSDPAYRMS